jgi:O-antigen ligase
MSRKRREGPRNARRPAAAVRIAPVERLDIGAFLAVLALIVVIVACGLAVDTGADDAFDAPKRLVSLFGVSAAAAALFAFSRWKNPLDPRRSLRVRLPLYLAGAALVLTVLSAAVSPRPVASLDALRGVLLTALVLPLGASRLFPRRGPLLVGAFLAIAAVNALVSLLQAADAWQPLPLETRGRREATGAFVGNVGYLALLLALAAIVAAAIVLHSRRTAFRVAAALSFLLSVAALMVNQNLTSLSALAVGLVGLLLLTFGRRAIVAIVAAAVLAGVAIAAYPPMRGRAREVVTAARAGDWDRVLTYRLGAWAAAREMALDRPVLGYGPGTFGAEFVPHRLRAEIKARRRYVNPLTTSSYAEAHSDYLQPFAEEGVVAALLAIAAAGVLLVSTVRAARRRQAQTGPRRAEKILLAALLSAGAAAAVTWFPFQRPVTAVPLLLVAGRAWRIGRDEAAEAAP